MERNESKMECEGREGGTKEKKVRSRMERKGKEKTRQNEDERITEKLMLEDETPNKQLQDFQPNAYKPNSHYLIG